MKRILTALLGSALLLSAGLSFAGSVGDFSLDHMISVPLSKQTSLNNVVQTDSSAKFTLMLISTTTTLPDTLSPINLENYPWAQSIAGRWSVADTSTASITAMGFLKAPALMDSIFVGRLVIVTDTDLASGDSLRVTLDPCLGGPIFLGASVPGAGSTFIKQIGTVAGTSKRVLYRDFWTKPTFSTTTPQNNTFWGARRIRFIIGLGSSATTGVSVVHASFMMPSVSPDAGR